ncbi:MAG TPA: VWA domain-containing protein, partial [Candidatus Limnocylindrales bacterium]|nr:VWA domain-containing protein [Candidatus Limnocylindrales bacterium]
ATPLALLGLLFVPLVVAMYLLKLRREPTTVPSTLLWDRLVADVEANAPWQRLRRSLLLLLQLLLVLALAILAARPFLERPAGLAGDLVLVVDASASMGATDVEPNRLEAAKAAALEALRELPAGGRVSVVAAGRTARVVANATTDLGRVRQAIASIEVTATSGDLGDALRLAGALAARSVDAEILVATDAALASPPTARVDTPVRVLQVGRDRKNQAIAALAVKTAPSAVTRSVFVSVANLDLEPAERRIELYGDDRLLEARDVFLDPQARADVVIDDVPRDVAVVEVRLVASDDAAASAPDRLAIDDRAWAVVPPDQLRRILLVGEGDPYLETALSYLPNTELYGVEPDAYGPGTKPELFDLVIFESFVPTTLPPTAILAIAPPRTSPVGEVTGTLRNPGIGALGPDEPILRYVDLTTTHIAQAQRLVLPDWARTVIPGPGGAPLLYIGDRAGQRTAVLAFEPRRSDLPLQVAFPILLANLAGELLGGSAGPADAVAPGSPVSLPIPAGATGLVVTRPDGSTVELAPGTPGAAAVTFTQTDLVGVYSAQPVRPAATADPSASAAPSPSAAPSATPSVAPSASAAPTAPPVDPDAPIRFAVDLFDVDESTIAPGSVAAIEALGRAPAPSASPGSGGSGSGASASDRQPARDELWGPILLVALVLLCVEWAVYQRDALLRGWRTLTARLRPRPGEGG